MRRLAALLFSAFVAVTAGGCSTPPEAPKAVSASQPTTSKTEAAAAGVKTSMQRKLDTDADLAPLRLTVADVTLVNKAGNEYKGIATIRTSSGEDHDVPIDVTADGDNIIWDAGPGAFAFAFEGPAPKTAEPSPAPAVASSGPQTLPQAADGRVYVATKSGKTRCRLTTFEIACQSPFIGAPMVYGQPANGIIFTANGHLTYVAGDIGNIRATVMDYRRYQALGWAIDATSDGTTFTHTGTGHHVSVSITSVQAG